MYEWARMNRIFLPLSVCSAILLMATFTLGWQIDDPRIADPAIQEGVQRHFLTALAALCFTTLVHAIVLTYFMGTGRWIEETSNAYRLDPKFYAENQRLKYRVVPALIGGFLLLLAAGAMGAAADPASPVEFTSAWGLSMTLWHRGLAITAVLANIAIHYAEYLALFRNGEIIDGVLAEVRRIRSDKGLAV